MNAGVGVHLLCFVSLEDYGQGFLIDHAQMALPGREVANEHVEGWF